MIEMISKLKNFKDMLKNAGLKPTFQRIKVLEHIDKLRYSHPTAEMIYNSLHKELPIISLTTVYNAIHTFHKKGILNALTITGEEIRYDPNTDSHHHFLCSKCGRIIDINITCPLANDKKNIIMGNRIDEVHGYFKGVCKTCLKKGADDGGKNR